jgi:tetratricopeptide (TPR) repeat protein
VISQLRKIADGIGAGSLEIETITKIGYRLTSDGDAPAGHRMPTARQSLAVAGEPLGTRPSRRTLLLGAAGALAATGGGAFLYRRLAHPTVPAEVEPLVTQARHLRDQNTREAQNQAIGLLQRVVSLAPDYADGWGMLGCSYAVPSHYRDRAEGIALRARANAAGTRALALNPGNGYGELALSLALPFIGHWRERDRRLDRALADRPDDGEMLAFRAVALIFVGRSAEALKYYERIRQRPLTPAVYNNFIVALWSAGMVEETDRAMEDAAALYPSHLTIWINRFFIQMFGGNPAKAIALAEDAIGRPDGIEGPALTSWLAQARAIESRDPAKVETVGRAQMRRAHVSAFGAETAMRVLSALGRIDDAFAVADAYYFADGFIVPDSPEPGSRFTADQRQTRMLFEPVARPMRADPRFEPLVSKIGLDRYWRESGVQPDYRRAS